MIKRFKRSMSIAVVTAMVAGISLSMVGCGKDTSDNGAAPESKKTEITFWEQDDTKTVGPTWDKIIKDFQTKYPNITVTKTHVETEAMRTNFQNQVSAGEGPSVISCPDDNIGVFGTAKTAMALDGVLSKDFLSTLDTKAVDGARLDGNLYGVPYHIGNALSLLYNKKLVTKAPETMDELISMGKQLTKAPDQYGLVFNMTEPFFYIPFLGGFGGQMFDNKGNITLNTAAMEKTTGLVYDFKFTHKIVPSDANYDVANNLFKEGKAAFIINGPWAYSEYKAAGIDFGITRIPKTADGKYPAPLTSSKVLILNSNLKDDAKDATIKFVEFINSKENQVEIAKVTQEFPTNVEALKDTYFTENSELKALADQMSVGTPMPIVPKMRAIWDGIRPVFTDVMNGKVSVKDAPKMMQEKAEEKAKALLGDTDKK